MRRFESPFLLRQQEWMQLVAADRPVAAHLVLEVDLLVAVVSAEDDQVAGPLEAVQPAQLRGQHLRLVESLEQSLRLRCQWRGQRTTAVGPQQRNTVPILD